MYTKVGQKIQRGRACAEKTQFFGQKFQKVPIQAISKSVETGLRELANKRLTNFSLVANLNPCLH